MNFLVTTPIAFYMTGRPNCPLARQQQTVGLVTLDDYKKRQDDVGGGDVTEKSGKRKRVKKKKKKSKKSKRKKAAVLSFDMNGNSSGTDGDIESGVGEKFGKFGKDPSITTDFLPDRDREVAENKQRELLKQELRDLPMADVRRAQKLIRALRGFENQGSTFAENTVHALVRVLRSCFLSGSSPEKIFRTRFSFKQ